MTVTSDLLHVEHPAVYLFDYLSVTGQRLALFTIKAMIGHLKSKLIRHH